MPVPVEPIDPTPPAEPAERDPLAAARDADGPLWDGFRELDRRLDAIRRELARHHRLTTLGTMAATIAHEINNLLTPVGSYAQLALSRPDDPELVRKALRHAAEGSAQAERIASAVLGLAGDRDEPRSAGVSGVVHEAAACLVRDPQRDGIELRHGVPDGVHAAIEPGKLRQVLLNLMLNACRAMHPRGGRLTIDGELAAGRVTIRVRDTGPGIPAAVRDRLFEPFVTAPIDDDAPPTSSSRSGGSGLGLSVCRQLIERAGGTIACADGGSTRDATPDARQGATFVIVLPAVTPVGHAA
ncbi:MAG: HAMP domain-containing sensor histidine kinase [Planctomycetota bacterium]